MATFLNETLNTGFGALTPSTPAPTIDSTVFWSGGGSAKTVTVADSRYVLYQEPGSANVIIGRFYWRRETGTGGGYMNMARISTFNAGNHIYITLKNDGRICISPVGGGNAAEQAAINASVVGTWYLVDFYFDITANPYQLKWKIDGVDQTTATPALAASTFGNYGFGNIDDNQNSTWYYDEIALSYSSADYPLGAVAQQGPPVNNPVWPRVRFNG